MSDDKYIINPNGGCCDEGKCGDEGCGDGCCGGEPTTDQLTHVVMENNFNLYLLMQTLLEKGVITQDDLSATFQKIQAQEQQQ